MSVLSLFEALEDAPYGLMPNNVSAFIMGFVLKEYAKSDYFWSNGSYSEVMTVDKMKTMIANALNQRSMPSPKYKEEYIVAMSAQIRGFLNCTSAAFHIPMINCGSVESARDQIRIKMKGLTFPIWCLKSVLGDVRLDSSPDDIAGIIDAYCGIANTANSGRENESELSFRGFEGEMLLHRLDLMGVCVSTGSACDSSRTQISHVLDAMGVPEEYALGTIRVSFGARNTEEDGTLVGRAIRKIIG